MSVYTRRKEGKSLSPPMCADRRKRQNYNYRQPLCRRVNFFCEWANVRFFFFVLFFNSSIFFTADGVCKELSCHGGGWRGVFQQWCFIYNSAYNKNVINYVDTSYFSIRVGFLRINQHTLVKITKKKNNITTDRPSVRITCVHNAYRPIKINYKKPRRISRTVGRAAILLVEIRRGIWGGTVQFLYRKRRRTCTAIEIRFCLECPSPSHFPVAKTTQKSTTSETDMPSFLHVINIYFFF